MGYDLIAVLIVGFTIVCGFTIHPLIGIIVVIVWVVKFRQWNKAWKDRHNNKPKD